MVPVTVKDPKGNPVAGLTWRDFTVYENNTRKPLRVFSVDPEAAFGRLRYRPDTALQHHG